MTVVGALLSLVVTVGAGSAESAAGRFAIVIGNNRSDEPGVADLRYADDDALAFDRLLREAGVETTLLADPDADTRRLHPEVRPRGLPRLDALRSALAQIDEKIRQVKALGQRAELFFFFSGHGDIEHGEGFAVLEDGRLTRSVLREVIPASAADVNHIIVDACKSYFLVYEKGPGGEREPVQSGFLDSADLPANTGVILSTSSDRDSHEWERFQGGIFSHEVCSGLRGAADANRDGAISYGELGSFLATANQTVANARFRPDFLVRPPGGAPGLSTRLLGWGAEPPDLEFDVNRGHLYVETAAGDRLLDVNAASGQTLGLRVPGERPLFIREADERAEYALTSPGPARLSTLRAGPSSSLRKGALHLAFERLFETPFGAAQVAAFESGFAGAPVVVSPVDVHNWTDAAKIAAAWTAIGAAAVD